MPALAAKNDLKTDAKASPAGSEVQLRPAISRTERDCVVFSFKREDPMTSERVRLVSREYRDSCRRDRRNRRNCREELAWTERRWVRVEITGRGEMLPWGKDVFRVCLGGRRLDVDVLDASHAYTFALRRDDTIEAMAQGKTISLPDPNGIYADSFHADAAAKNFVLDLKDRWPGHYAGEQVVLNVILRRYRENWFDDTLVEKEIPLPVGPFYRFSFADFSWETDKATLSAAAPGILLAAKSSGIGAAGWNPCWFQRIERDQCVYECQDGSEYRQPVRTPDPWDQGREETIPCPQLVFPF